MSVLVAPRALKLCALAILSLLASASAAEIDFNRHIRPILSDKCYACHGPDEAERKAGLRLDQKKGALAALDSGDHAIVPGDLEKSVLISRITTTDVDDRMPPTDGGKPLTPEEIDLLKKWVKSGAQWDSHWAYVAPERPEIPRVKKSGWVQNEIDNFILARLEKEGLQPSPEADKPTLIRRATLDLTGLPPTVEEVDAFLADNSSDAYEKVVDRLLAAPAYGERMAMNWLDLARYADTSGYHFDSPRYMWIWRDWVINAFNKNMPFDQFTVEQLAGDLLPNATLEQKIASGFNRNVMTNDEGGADPDEYLNKYIVDRVNTTAVTWLGTTVGCAECHDHKYDPISTKEFYQMYAFFHNIAEKGLDGTRTENPLPRISVPTPQQASELIELDRAVTEAEANLKTAETKAAAEQSKWEGEIVSKGGPRPPTAGLLAYFALQETGDYVAHSGSKVTAQLSGDPTPIWSDGRLGKAIDLNGKNQFVAAKNFAPLDRTNSFSFGAWIQWRGGNGAVLSRMKDEDSFRGWDLLVIDGFLEIHMVNKWPENGLKVRSKTKFPANVWTHVFSTYDGASKAAGLKIYVNGQEQILEVQNDKLTDTILTDLPLHIGKRSNSFFFNGLIDEVRLYNRALPSDEVVALALEGFWPILALPVDRRTAPEAEALRAFYRETFATEYKNARDQLALAKARKTDLLAKIPNTMVMQELEQPRETFILVRGNFQKKGEKVSPQVPEVWPPLPEGMPANRLALAKWLVNKDHPLTSRVTVNRYWGMFFGNGLVKTVNDFGSQGEWPSHPELLEWLACQFRDGGGSIHARPWDLKALVKLIVTSSAYRQSGAVTPRILERDPYNRLLTRGPRLRLEAEFIRDNALAISGLLNEKVGGESVRPYQPAGLWDVTDTKYEQSHGEDLYRRGMYVYWKRAVHYPSFATFDAPSRETCTAQRPRTSTPLQSFVLMNDPVYVEAARAFGARMMKEGGKDAEDRLLFGFRATLARRPTHREITTLHQTLSQMLEVYSRNTKAAEELTTVGESPRPKDLDPVELAAYTCVANVLLNLNETISK